MGNSISTTENLKPNSKKKAGLSRKTKRTLFIVGMLAIPIIQYLIFFVYVNIDTVLMAFQTAKGKWDLYNFQRFFEAFKDSTSIDGQQLKYAIINSLLVCVNDLLLLTISTMLAYFFFKKIKGAAVFRIIFFLPSIISMVIYISVFKYMFNSNIGIVNKILGIFGIEPVKWLVSTSNWLMPLVLLYCLWVGTGYNILVMGGAMANLPKDVMEYSKLEGVGFMREFFQIIIPMIWPTVMVGLIGSVTVMFTLFMQVDLMTETGGNYYQAYTIAYYINSLVKTGKTYWAANLGVCFTVIAIPIIISVRLILNKISEHFGY